MLPGRSSRTPTTLELCLEATWNVYMMQVLKLIWFRLRSASSEVGRHNSAQGKGTVSSHTALNCSKLLWKYHNPAQSINILCLVSVGQSFDHQTMIHDMRSLALKTSCCLFDVPGPQRMPNSAAWWPGEKWQMLHEDMICMIVCATFLASACGRTALFKSWSNKSTNWNAISQISQFLVILTNSPKQTPLSLFHTCSSYINESLSWSWGEPICCLTGLSSRKSWTSFCTSRKRNAKCQTD